MRYIGRFVQHNWVFLLLLTFAVGIYLVFVFPWLWEARHQGLSIIGLVFFGLIAVYGRAPVPKALPQPPAVLEQPPASDRDEGPKAA
jgi:hypothetical protein